MEIKFKAVYANEELHYAVGTVEPAADYAMRVIDPTHIIMTDHENWKAGTDPSAIFGITEEEYNWKDTDHDKLDELAQKLRTDIPKDRLIGEKDGVRTKNRVESIDYGKYQRYAKERNEKRRDEIITRILEANALYVAYCNETGKPYVFGFNFLLIYEDKAMAMEAANEYRRRNIPILMSEFTKDKFNQEETKSIFQELIVMGYPTVLFVDSEKRQSLVLLKDIIKHPTFLGQKTNLIYGNPLFDFAVTNLFQFLRTPNLMDRSDPEKYKEALTKRLSFYESRVIEAISGARFLVPTLALPDNKVSTPIIKTKEEEQYLPVFSNGMEFYTEKTDYKAAVMTYDAVLEFVRKAKLNGFVINMKSKCNLKCGEERFKQVEDFRKWKAEQDEKRKAAGEGEPSADSSEKTAIPEDIQAQGDQPFVPIIHKKDEKDVNTSENSDHKN